MKKRLSICLCLVLALSLLAGCGAQKAPAAAPTAEEPAVGLPNPVKASSAEEIAARFGVEMKAPDGAEELSWTVIEGDMPLAQLGFSLGGIAYNYRVAKAEAYEDISGMYYEWQEVSAEEGGGSIRLISGEAGVYDRFDAEEGLVYSLSMGNGASPETLRETARLLWGDPSAEELRALLEGVRGRYFPGTAGSSLSAAACAAELADFFLESGVGPDEVDRVVQLVLEHASDRPRESLMVITASERHAVRVELDGVRGVANYGRAPTLGERAWPVPVWEVHFLDPADPGARVCRDSERLAFSVRRFIRPERKFASLDELKAQIAADVREAARA